MTLKLTSPLTLAIPKGRIYKELAPLLGRVGITPDAAFFDDGDRALKFATNIPGLSIIRVRAFDVATFVAHGAAELGVVGSDVIQEFSYAELYAPLDLGIGKCRLSVAEPAVTVGEPGDKIPVGILDCEAARRARVSRPESVAISPRSGAKEWSVDHSAATHTRVATKYPNITERYFAQRGVVAECIALSGAMELAPATGLAQRIVDLVSTGDTLRANGLVEIEKVMDVSARLIVNRSAYKTRSVDLTPLIDALREACHAA
jgi:ATP phosphoribosyltransferase